MQRVAISHPQNLLPSQYAHIFLISSRTKVLRRDVCDMVRVFFVPDEDRLDFPIAMTFDVIQLNTLRTL